MLLGVVTYMGPGNPALDWIPQGEGAMFEDIVVAHCIVQGLSTMSYGKTAEPFDMQFGMETRVDHVLEEGRDRSWVGACLRGSLPPHECMVVVSYVRTSENLRLGLHVPEVSLFALLVLLMATLCNWTFVSTVSYDKGCILRLLCNHCLSLTLLNARHWMVSLISCYAVKEMHSAY